MAVTAWHLIHPEPYDPECVDCTGAYAGDEPEEARSPARLLLALAVIVAVALYATWRLW